MLLHKDGVTLDIAAWPLDKNDIQDLRWVVLNDTEIWLAQGMTRTNQVVLL